MALQPSLRPLIIAGQATAPHTIDLFLDFVCPFCAKTAVTIDNVIIPLLSSGGKYEGKVKAIFRPHPQPWHASSTLTHEAALAVLKAYPDKFWKFSSALFAHQTEYFDVPTSTQTPVQTREKLANLAGEVIGGEGVADKIKDLLAHKTSGNGGNAVTDDLRYSVKYARQNSIHFSPTVLWDGVIEGSISSSWGEKEWTEFLEKKVSV
ncbi:thioredoxin-like protein [Schizophyllum commune]|uniref:Thioredoxin-like fold domain-containing protein n=1 Tax=Schizophyllum commune (strain H4-8 / FGSC 9210) TaxID=578458 RepID=D8PQG8_SCHCM|nr:thioredoxin-like protein [Schizophyllum commune H4-8]KAI5893607.1 thioredoxin-like protein [Schizophyllum commune H4-8]